METLVPGLQTGFRGQIYSSKISTVWKLAILAIRWSEPWQWKNDKSSEERTESGYRNEVWWHRLTCVLSLCQMLRTAK